MHCFVCAYCPFPFKCFHTVCIFGLVLLPIFDPSSCNSEMVSRPLTTQTSLTEVSKTLRGDLTPTEPSYSYRFRALAGQTLAWRFEGPAVRIIITYPDGAVEGPGLPAVVPLPQTGDYTLAIHSNLMAENIYGPFQLTMTIR
jgi:hypothetical protein